VMCIPDSRFQISNIKTNKIKIIQIFFHFIFAKDNLIFSNYQDIHC